MMGFYLGSLLFWRVGSYFGSTRIGPEHKTKSTQNWFQPDLNLTWMSRWPISTWLDENMLQVTTPVSWMITKLQHDPPKPDLDLRPGFVFQIWAQLELRPKMPKLNLDCGKVGVSPVRVRPSPIRTTYLKGSYFIPALWQFRDFRKWSRVF